MISTRKFVIFSVLLGCFVFWIFFSFGSSSFCRSTEHDHVKDNLPAKLLRIRTFGKMKLEEFKDLISPADYKLCESKMEKHPTWYPLTLDVFVKFLYKVTLPSFVRVCFLLVFWQSLTLIILSCRESYLAQLTMQQGCTGRLHPSRSGPLPKFVIL